MEEKKLHPELKDVLESIYRYNITHKEGCFVYNFVGFQKDPEHKCVDCGEPCEIFDEEKSMIGAYGNKETIRLMLNELRNMIEDETDEDGFVNL